MSAIGTKGPAVAPTEGLLTEAVQKPACVVRTADRDPNRTPPDVSRSTSRHRRACCA
jgi:hypothetical protein